MGCRGSARKPSLYESRAERSHGPVSAPIFGFNAARPAIVEEVIERIAQQTRDPLHTLNEAAYLETKRLQSSGHPDLVPYQAFRARDGWFIVACLTNAFWKRLAPAIGRPDLLEHPKFKNMKDRVEHRTEVVATLGEIFAGRDVAHWISLLEENDIPTCRVNRLEEILVHPQIESNAAVTEREHPVLGRFRTLTPAVKLSATPSSVARSAPTLCQHTRDVLREAGLEEAEIESLLGARAIA